MVAAGAHHDEDLHLVEEDLVPRLQLGLPLGGSRLKLQEVLGGEGHKGEEVALGLPPVGREEEVGGSGGVRVGQLIAGLPDKMREPGNMG